MTFTFGGFISYTLFIVICTFVLIVAFPKIERKNKCGSKCVYNQQQGEKLKVGGIYGRKRLDADKNDPFSTIRKYDYYLAILDIKPSRDGDCDYCQYVYLNDNMLPYGTYSNSIIYSDMTKNFDNWEYVKDIDLDTIKIS